MESQSVKAINPRWHGRRYSSVIKSTVISCFYLNFSELYFSLTFLSYIFVTLPLSNMMMVMVWCGMVCKVLFRGGGGAPCEPTAIHIACPTVSADVLLQLGYILLGDWWQALHSGHRKTLHSTKHTKSTKKNLKTHYMGVPLVLLPFTGQLTG